MAETRVGILIHLPPEIADQASICAQRSGRSRKAEIEVRVIDHLNRFKASNQNIITKEGVKFVAIENDD
jgi:hypothetical protein